jgi:hypothetical protein
MTCNEDGKGNLGLENTVDLTKMEKFNQNVNQLLDEFTKYYPEMQDEINLTKEKFPTISTFSKFDLRWKLTNYLTYRKEDKLEEILNEEDKRYYNCKNIIKRSKEVISWIKNGPLDKYNEYFDALTFVNFGNTSKIPFYDQLGKQLGRNKFRIKNRKEGKLSQNNKYKGPPYNAIIIGIWKNYRRMQIQRKRRAWKDRKFHVISEKSRGSKRNVLTFERRSRLGGSN